MTTYSGFLSKQSFGFFSNWKHRYFELNGSNLAYYVDESKNVKKGEYILDKVSKLGTCEDIGVNTFCIRIVTSTREIILSAGDEVARSEWMYKLNCAIAELKGEVYTDRDSRATALHSNTLKHAHQLEKMQVDALSPLAGLIEGVSDFCVDDGSDDDEDDSIQLPHDASLDVKRRALYSEMGIPKDFVKTRAVMANGKPNLHFSDHALGAIPPLAYYKASRRVYGMYCGLVNGMWDALWGDDIPKLRAHVKRLFGFEASSEDVNIELAHNTHQIVTSIISTQFDRIVADKCTKPLRILTTNDEFYSLTRQLNRFQMANTSRIVIDVVDVMPLETFSERALAYIRANASKQYDFLYFSHVSFVQRTLLPDLRYFVTETRKLIEPSCVLIIDGYHSFGAFDVNLKGLDCIFLCGLLKHMGCGANLCLAVVPARVAQLKPFITGWLSDFSVLAPDSEGIKHGSEVGYMPGVTFMGSTPSFNMPVVTFNNVIEGWRQCNININVIHAHVISLHEMFLDGLDEMEKNGKGNEFVNRKRLLCYQDSPHRSHTLVFVQDSAGVSMRLVDYVASYGITIDSRKVYVRIGFGFNHNPEDIDRLIRVLTAYGKGTAVVPKRRSVAMS